MIPDAVAKTPGNFSIASRKSGRKGCKQVWDAAGARGMLELFSTMNPPAATRILVLESAEDLASRIVEALREVSPGATIDIAHSLEDAQSMAGGTKPDLFVLDVDATPDLGQEFLYDLRTSHQIGRAHV